MYDARVDAVPGVYATRKEGGPGFASADSEFIDFDFIYAGHGWVHEH